jgi:hypothetical protein
MTHSFPWSRLAEIADAAPVQPVAFPGCDEVVVLRRTLAQMRELLMLHGAGSGAEPAHKGRRRARSR